MRIYFAGSIRAGRRDVSIYKDLVEYLKQFGEVLTEHVGDYRLSIQGQTKFSDQYIHDRKTGVFHLEVILDSNNIPYFLEIGARMGGGEIVPLCRMLYGIDLVKALFQAQIQTDIILQDTSKRKKIGGFLLVPEPSNTPCKVKSRKEVTGCETSVKQILPEVGKVLDGHGGYFDNSGRFIFISPNSELIEQDITRILNTYEIEYEKI